MRPAFALVVLTMLVSCGREQAPPVASTEVAGPISRGRGATAAPAPADASAPVSVPPPATVVPKGIAGTAPAAGAATEPWRALTQFDFAALPIAQMPPDDGNVSPMAAEGEAPIGESIDRLKQIEAALPTWSPAQVPDRAQRVRNALLILSVADLAQSPVERFLPGTVLAYLLTEFPREDLAQMMCWAALHAEEGDLPKLTDPLLMDLGAARVNPDEVRTRIYYYGVKLTRRIIGW